MGEQLERAVADNPHPTVAGSRSGGQLVRSPGFLALRDASLLVRQLGAELGLSPAAREQVSRTGGHVAGGFAGRHVGGGWLS